MKYRSENQRCVELGEGLAHKINTAFNKRPVRITKDAEGTAAMSDEDIELPPLPKASKMYDIPGYDEEELKDYARTAILADRARRELLAERDELAKDAARYRWLRKGESDDVAVVRGLGATDYGMSAVVYTYSEDIDGDDLDAAIDAAMRKEGRGDE